MQLGVLDRDGGLAGHAGQHIQVFTAELLPVGRVYLDDPQRLLIGDEQRDAHHRCQVAGRIGDASGLPGSGATELAAAGIFG